MHKNTNSPDEQAYEAQERQEIGYELPDANPIQKRQKLEPYSIFPMLALPRFNYNSEIAQPTAPSDPGGSASDKFILPSSSLKELFVNPIYVYNGRAQMKTNSDFGCLRVQAQESSNYKIQKDCDSYKEYKSVHRKQEQPTQNQQLNNQQGSQDEIENEEKDRQEILFQSRFQSGNLCFVARSQENEPTYYLILNRDMNTSKCTQWFFFKTLNKLAGKVTFHILNFVKSYSIFQNGMKICLASKSNGYRWIRGCSQIKYRPTNLPINPKNKEKCYYALTFSYTYSNPEDSVYFAYCYPYTYSHLEQFLFHRAQGCGIMKRRNIAVTLGGNNVDLVTISNFRQKQHKKRVVFVTARVHPGETPSSFICEGMMRYLLGESEEARALRDNFIFKFVPMLNPDGVINGSYRCSLSGYDLNRVWHRADKFSHPEIYGTRKAIFETNQIDRIFMFADLHAHSKKKGVFAYGCQDKNNPYLCRQIPFLFWKNVPDFNYYQCNFMMRTGREGTSRLYIYRELDIDLSYTIEHSFCGPSKEKLHYTPKDYMKIGMNYLLTFHKYFCRNKKSPTLPQSEIFEELYRNKELAKVGEVEELSSSDEELDKERAPIGITEHKTQRKSLVNRETLRMSEGTITNAKRTVSNFRKTNLQPNDSGSKEYFGSKIKEIQEFGETVRPLPVVGPNFRERRPDRQEEVVQYISFRPRVCSSSLTGPKPEAPQRKRAMRQTFRYEQQQQVNSLTNLFLPSLTRALYKKYSRKSSSPRNLVHIGSSLVQNAIILKQQIKSTQKRRPGWKDQARSYL